MNKDKWIQTCNEWKNKWPVYQSEYTDDTGGLNIYEILETINEHLTDKQIIVTDAGSPSYACPTALKAVTYGQFVFNPSQADMGWAIPASVGIALNADNKITLCIVGDGSFYSNMQEIAVIKHHNLPVKIIVLNNNGYLSIKNTQTKYFEGRIYGVNSNTGLFFAELADVAKTFKINYRKISNRNELKAEFENVMTSNYPEIIEIICKEDQEILPAQSFKISPDGTKIQAPLHDMYPFLPEEELIKEFNK